MALKRFVVELGYGTDLQMIDGINLAFQDCHVDFIRYSQLREAFANTNKYLKEHKLPEVDVDALLKAAPGRH